MKKKEYIAPLSEVTHLGSGILMEAFGPASMPHDPFGSAPGRGGAGPNRTPVF